MTDILIRGLSDAAIERIDAAAAAMGLSRNEFLPRKLEGGMASSASDARSRASTPSTPTSAGCARPA